MAKMIEAVKRLYKGKDALNRQICFFSVCGIIGLVNGYLSIADQNINELNLYQKIGFTALIILFSMFITGFETIFLHSREMPDVNFEPFKIAGKKIPFLIFLACIPLALISLFTKYQYQAFCVETLLAIPFTMLQAGFSYNYNNDDALLLFKKFKLKEFLSLLLKRLWVIILCYLITLTIIFIVFFIGGIAIAVMYKGDISTIAFTISSQQVIISKLSNYITAIILTYSLSIGTLVWDYELIKTYEREYNG